MVDEMLVTEGLSTVSFLKTEPLPFCGIYDLSGAARYESWEWNIWSILWQQKIKHSRDNQLNFSAACSGISSLFVNLLNGGTKESQGNGTDRIALQILPILGANINKYVCNGELTEGS